MIENARQSSDTQVVRQLNNAIAIESAYNQGEMPATMHDAVQITDDYGYNVGKIVAKSSLSIAWDNSAKRFVLLNEEEGTYVFPLDQLNTKSGKIADDEKINYFVVRDSVPVSSKASEYSIYAGENWSEKNPAISVGFDAGDRQDIASITYTSYKGQDVVICTNGGTLNVSDTTGGKQYFYGYAENADVTTGTSCFEVFGAIKTLALKEGKAVIQKSGVVVEVSSESVSSAVIENNGYVAKNNSSIQISGSKATAGENYKIGNLAELKAFRDAVNGGFDFEELTVELTADIELTEGWKPIGSIEHSFAGSFNGNGHSIKGLKNPETGNGALAGYDKNGNHEYAFGFFGVLGNGGLISNIKFTNVKIDETGAFTAKHVGTLVGFVTAFRSFDNITVGTAGDGSFVKIKTGKCGGIIGRIEEPTGQLNATAKISNCTNYADVTSAKDCAAGIVGFVCISKDDKKVVISTFEEFTFDNCINYGDITVYAKSPETGNSNGSAAGIYVCNSDTFMPRLGVRRTNGNYHKDSDETQNIYYENNCYNRGIITANAGAKACNLIGNTSSSDDKYINVFGVYWYNKSVILSKDHTETFIPTPNTGKGEYNESIVIGVNSVITGDLDCGISKKFTFPVDGIEYTIEEGGNSITVTPSKK